MRIEELVKTGKNVPSIGMGCTIHYYSDAEPATVTRVSTSGKTCWIRRNETEADPSKGELYIGHQNWIIKKEFTNESEMRVSLRNDGQWRCSKSNLYVELGRQHKYYDWEF